MKAKKSAFLKRKDCVMKKTMDLSVLCDINACAIIVDEDGSIETWPRNSTDVNQILDRYRQKHSLNKKKQSNNVCNGVENPKEVLSKLNSKIEAVTKRIEFLKGKSIMNRDGGEGKRKEFIEILREIIGGSSSSATVNVQESDPIERSCPLEYYWDRHIELSDNSYVTANYIQEVGFLGQLCPEAYYWDGGDTGLMFHNTNNQNLSADFDLLLREEYLSEIF